MKAKPLPVLKDTDAARFWSNVAISDNDSCWHWQRAIVNKYGAFKVSGRMLKAHRVAYFLQTGIDPGELLTRHSCDNPICCNPSHLLIGSSAENTADMLSRSRHRALRGEQASWSRLTDADVIEIRYLYAHRLASQDQLSQRFGVKSENISRIVTRKSWRHLLSDAEKQSRPARQRIT